MPATGMRRFCVAVVVCLGVGMVHRGLLTFCPGQSPPGAGQAPQTRGGLMMRHAEGTTMEKPSRTGSQWRLNVGRALDVLRRDVAGLFSRRNYTPDFSIYSPEIEVTDARLPSFKIKGLASYQQVLSTLQWSLRTTCHSSKLEITSITPPVNNDMYLRWRLKLWFKDVRSWFGIGQTLGASAEIPFIVEGYSKYTFDPWSAEIVKHTIDITNPPMYLSDLMASYAAPSWLTVSQPMPGLSAWPFAAAAASGGAFVGGTAGAAARREGSGATGATWATARAAGFSFGLPQGCEDDFECNDGKANFPLQCCEMPLLGKFCCEPPDFSEGGVRNEMPAYVPLPVPVDPLQDQ